jgi:ketosteroid isomerase-like protein
MLLLACLVNAQTLPREQEEVLRIEDMIAKAIVHNDTSAVARYLAEGFTMTVLEGANISKQGFLRDMTVFWKPFSQQHRAQLVRVSENTGIISGIAEFAWRAKNGDTIRAAEQYTDTYIRTGQGWQKYASHSIAIVPNDSIAKNDVQRQSETLWKAWETGNRALAEPIYADDFIDTDFGGTKRNRASVLAFLKPHAAEQTVKITLTDWHFVVRPSTVVVNYIGEDVRTKNGLTEKWRFRATDTFVYRYGRWKIIAGQQIPLKADGKEK